MECFIVFWFYINNIVTYSILPVGHSSIYKDVASYLLLLDYISFFGTWNILFRPKPPGEFRRPKVGNRVVIQRPSCSEGKLGKTSDIFMEHNPVYIVAEVLYNKNI